jgi:hypothetical protein
MRADAGHGPNVCFSSHAALIRLRAQFQTPSHISGTQKVLRYCFINSDRSTPKWQLKPRQLKVALLTCSRQQPHDGLIQIPATGDLMLLNRFFCKTRGLLSSWNGLTLDGRAEQAMPCRKRRRVGFSCRTRRAQNLFSSVQFYTHFITNGRTLRDRHTVPMGPLKKIFG